MSSATRTSEIESMVETLLGLLQEQLRCARRLERLARQRLLAEARGHHALCQDLLELGRDALLDHALAERERIACLTELGLALGAERPSRLRIAQLIHHVGPELRDELLEVREDLRDVADDLASLRAWGCRLEHHHLGNVILFLAPGISAESSRGYLRRLRRRKRSAVESARSRAEPGVPDDA